MMPEAKATARRGSRLVFELPHRSFNTTDVEKPDGTRREAWPRVFRIIKDSIYTEA
jgi:hypothetical protein